METLHDLASYYVNSSLPITIIIKLFHLETKDYLNALTPANLSDIAIRDEKIQRVLFGKRNGLFLIWF